MGCENSKDTKEKKEEEKPAPRSEPHENSNDREGLEPQYSTVEPRSRRGSTPPPAVSSGPRRPQDDLYLLNDFSEIQSYTYDEGTLTLTIEEKMYMVMIPDEYPHGEPVILDEDSTIIPQGNMHRIARSVIDVHNGKGGGGLYRDGTTFSVGEGELSLLQKDVQRFCQIFGSSAAEVDTHVTAYDRVKLKIDCSRIISKTTAKAWGFELNAPVEIQVKFSTRQYIEQSRPPQVSFTQNGAKFPVGQQLGRALRDHLPTLWRAGLDRASGGNDSNMKLMEQLQYGQRKTFTALLDMGFEGAKAFELAKSYDSLQDALDNMHGDTKKKKAVDDSKYDPANDFNKLVPYSPEEGFLVYLAQWFQKRLPTTSNYCVICDRPHLFGQSMISPCCCSRAVCTFGFRELNVGADSTERVAMDTAVVDLLISVFKCAALNSRANFVLNPYPSIPDPNSRGKLAFDPDYPDYSKVSEVTNMIPNTKDYVEGTWRPQSGQELVHPLVDWIVSSNRSHIVQLPEAHRFPTMNTNFQYVFVTAAPEKEERFQQLKKRNGTRWAFHGSRAENWHAILRNGLKNMSGTSGQLNGSAHGSGIYFAPQASSSLGYCRSSNIGEHFEDENYISVHNMVVLALCEIIDSEINDHGWCWTLANEDHVITRFMFVYDSGSQSTSADTKNSNFQQEIARTMNLTYGE